MTVLAEPAAVCLDFEQVRRILPHRFPLILIDRVIELDPGSRIVALKNVTGNEMHFLGHFAEFAIMPGVLIIEAAAQAVTLLSNLPAGEPPAQGTTSLHYLANANMSFRAPVTPGDQMILQAAVHRRLGNLLVAKVKIFVSNKLVADGELTVGRKQ
jgi:3-hydroxyacyl-[acyl-carrier-protein] dehydratase